MPSIKERRAGLLRLFRNLAYRRNYVEAFYNTRLAAQIKLLREASGTSQTRLGKRLATQQSAISKLENANYSNWNVKTLRRLARAFDVAIQVRFVSFGEALADIEQFNTAALLKAPFKDDPVFHAAPENLSIRSTQAGVSPTGFEFPQASEQPGSLWTSLPSFKQSQIQLAGGVVSSDPLQAANDNLALAS